MKSRLPLYIAGFLLALVPLSGCKTGMMFGGKSPHEAYADRLRRAEMDKTAMGAQWFAAADKSLTAPLEIPLPYRETGFFPPDMPLAFGYSFKAERGKK
ncbi:MAG TPA: hypothetical protein VEB42_01435 [Chitinophagaceae bacterium]|nr:hypothetical protein [Chitinophagaceae bacterium]